MKSKITLSLLIMAFMLSLSCTASSSVKTPMPVENLITFTPEEVVVHTLPTLSVVDSAEIVNDLLLYNGGCKLPCFWGVVPGTTEWNTAKAFLQTFAEIREGKHYSIKVRESEYHHTSLIEFNVEKNVIIEITVGLPFTRNFTIEKVLTDYGKPDEVYLLTYRNSPTNPIPSFLILSYQHQGILAQYEFESQKVNDNDFLICSQPIGPSLWLRSPQKMLSDLEINQSVFGEEPSLILQKIDEVSDITIEKFYNEFKENSACFYTPINIWP